jgi:flagellar protein FliL
MAKDEDEDEKKGEASGGGKKKLFIIIGAVVLVLILGGVGAFFALSGKSKAATGEEGAEEDEEAEEEEEEHGGEGAEGELPGHIEPLETFIVNLTMKGSFLKTNIQLQFAEPEKPKLFDNDIPKVRDAIIRVLSGKKADEILTQDGKEKLRTEVKDAVNQAIGTEDIVQVYFTDFIVQ